MQKKGRVLVVEDDPATLQVVMIVLKSVGFEVVGVGSITLANEAISASLRERRFFNLAVLDLHVGLGSGGEFGRRLIEIIGNINVMVMTAHPEPAALLTYRPDSTVIKPVNLDTLREESRKLLKPLRRQVDSIDVMLNHWLATSNLHGFESLKFHSSKVDTSKPGEDVEKITSIATLDGAYINTVLYNNKKVDKRVVNIALSSLLGCLGQCVFCQNHRNRKDSDGCPAGYLRQLTVGEIMGQAYLALNRPRVKRAFKKGSKLKLVFNLTCEGDGLVWNLDNCMRAFTRLSEITNLEISFIITSIGSESSLREFTRKYVNLPRTRHYRSIDSLVPKTRKQLKPGAAGESLKKLRDADEIIARITNEPVTISWALIKGVNDRPEDAAMIADFYGNRYLPDGRPIFRIKLMPLVPGSLDGVEGFEAVESTSPVDMKRFKRLLVKLGLKDVRERDIVGLLINAGCGNTTVEWL